MSDTGEVRWIRALGSGTKTKKKCLYWTHENADCYSEPLTCARGLIIPVSDWAKDLCLQHPTVNNHEIADLLLMPLDPFINKDISSNFFIKYVKNTVLCRHWNTIWKYKLMHLIPKGVAKRGYMWTRVLRQELQCLKGKNASFLCAVESCGSESSKNSVIKYPKINFNIPGGRLEPVDLNNYDSGFAMDRHMIIENMCRELREEIGLIIPNEPDGVLSEKYQKEMRIEYDMHCPLIIRIDTKWPWSSSEYLLRKRFGMRDNPHGTAVPIILM